VTDVGGNLLGALEERGVEWEPILRTNRRNLHPLWFGVYGDLVYHHGGGFRRRPISRVDAALVHRRRLGRWPGLRRLEHEWIGLRNRRGFDRTERLSEEIFGRLQRDEAFWRELFG
jgi:hypothetical protein